ncbi:longiborneol synthase [Xylariaceae sp. FL0255]|nr:longiborneol synthase [Xylariaceae sp. FL0255]
MPDVALEESSLASLVRSICSDLLKKLNYPSVPQPSGEAAQALLEHMHSRATGFGLSLDTSILAKGFRLGHYLAVLAYPRHPLEVQGYVGLMTFLVVQYDDTVEQKGEMVHEAQLFHQRLFRGETQGNPLLQALAAMILEAYDHFDAMLANMLQISILKFLTSNLMERHEGFQEMPITPAGRHIAYAIFCYPKKLYPDVSAFLEALPDIARFTDISNDMLSFYKEEIGGDHRNYPHNRTKCTNIPLITVLEKVKDKTIKATIRVNEILRGKPEYLQSWNQFVRGYVAIHTSNSRYRLIEIGLGKEHPLP